MNNSAYYKMKWMRMVLAWRWKILIFVYILFVECFWVGGRFFSIFWFLIYCLGFLLPLDI